MKKISTIEEFDELLQTKQKFFMFKHSLTCPISYAAFEEYKEFINEHPEVTSFYLAVQEARPLSAHIAETFAIKHESPQAFYIMDGKVVWHDSHRKITKAALLATLQENE